MTLFIDEFTLLEILDNFFILNKHSLFITRCILQSYFERALLVEHSAGNARIASVNLVIS